MKLTGISILDDGIMPETGCPDFKTGNPDLKIGCPVLSNSDSDSCTEDGSFRMDFTAESENRGPEASPCAAGRPPGRVYGDVFGAS
jgi:hypothetical protein